MFEYNIQISEKIPIKMFGKYKGHLYDDPRNSYELVPTKFATDYSHYFKKPKEKTRLIKQRWRIIKKLRNLANEFKLYRKNNNLWCYIKGGVQ
jgi:hypothetical protein